MTKAIEERDSSEVVLGDGAKYDSVYPSLSSSATRRGYCVLRKETVFVLTRQDEQPMEMPRLRQSVRRKGVVVRESFRRISVL